MRALVLEEFGGPFVVKDVAIPETMDLVARGRIQPIVDRVFSLQDAELAFDALRQGLSLGRNVLAI